MHWLNLLMPHAAIEHGRSTLSRALTTVTRHVVRPALSWQSVDAPMAMLAVTDGIWSEDQTAVGRTGDGIDGFSFPPYSLRTLGTTEQILRSADVPDRTNVTPSAMLESLLAGFPSRPAARRRRHGRAGDRVSTIVVTDILSVCSAIVPPQGSRLPLLGSEVDIGPEIGSGGFGAVHRCTAVDHTAATGVLVRPARSRQRHRPRPQRRHPGGSPPCGRGRAHHSGPGPASSASVLGRPGPLGY